MLILAHRGWHHGCPENTLESFRQAVARGVDGIETDVRLSRDGQAILFHDRLAPDGRKVGAHSQAELSALVGYPVPTLASALELDHRLLWNIEIKELDAVAAALPVLRQCADTRRLLVTSFCHPLIEQIARQLEAPCGLLIAHRPLESVRLQEWLPAKVQALVWDIEAVDADVLERTHVLGLSSYVYGANTREDQDRLAALGVAGIITDHPPVREVRQPRTLSPAPETR